MQQIIRSYSSLAYHDGFCIYSRETLESAISSYFIFILVHHILASTIGFQGKRIIEQLRGHEMNGNEMYYLFLLLVNFFLPSQEMISWTRA